MEFISKGGVKICDICGEMNPLVIFCIGGSEFVFHLDGELNRDAPSLHVSYTAHFIGDDETLQRYIFRLL